tara:strand:+ start:1340 stop:1618 length:279 start_codon:yes stop_codon:yes gene_type:complete
MWRVSKEKYSAGDFFLCGPFADTRQGASDFSTSLYFSHLFAESVRKHQELQEIYDRAEEENDEEEMAQAKLEMSIHESSFQLTATILDDMAS